MPVWSTQAANEFIELSLADGKALTHMQVQKLVYIAHGWSLAMLDKGLTLDDPEAWKFGPVYRLMWDQLQHYGRYAIGEKIPKNSVLPSSSSANNKLNGSLKEMVGQVHHAYGRLAGFQLSNLTHRGDTPWRKIYNGGYGENQIIPEPMIKEHYIALGKKYRAERAKSAA